MRKLLLWSLLLALSLAAGVGVYQWRQADLITLDGQQWRWRELRGDWVVVNYFAEWCAPCLREVPELNHFYQSQQQSNSGVHLLGVSFDELSRAKLALLQQKYDFQFPLLDPQQPQQLPMSKPRHLPATYLINPQGEVVDTLLGEQTRAGLEKRLKQLGAL